LVLVALFSVALSIDVPAGYKLTPYGVRPLECVLELPSGSHIHEHESGLRVVTPEGEYIYSVPEICHQDDVMGKYNEKMKQKLSGQVNAGFPEINGWLDYAGWYPPSAESNLDSFTSTYVVPGNPPADSGQVLFWFIGMQDNAYAAVNILQPVLTWGNGVKGWNLASWDCSPKNITVQSKTITGFGTGDTIRGTIKRQTDSTWYIDATIEKTGANTTLFSHVGDYLYNWADVTLEVYSVTACNQFSSGAMTFENLVLMDVQQATLTPSWTLTRETTCTGIIQIVDPLTMTITHSTTG